MNERGAWIISIFKTISQFDLEQAAFDPLEALIIAGKAADLFSATRSLGEIEPERFDRYRKIARFKPRAAESALAIASKAGFLTVESANGAVKRYRFHLDNKEAVLGAAEAVFNGSEPTGCAEALLSLMAMTVGLPRRAEDLKNDLIGAGHREADVDSALMIATGVGLVSNTSETDHGQTVLMNPCLFQRAPKDSEKVLLALNEQDQLKAQQILSHVRTSPGVPLPPALHGGVLQLLVKIGLVDFSKITTAQNAQGRLFATAPAAWGVFQQGIETVSKDVTDDAKLFLNSLRYGEFYSAPHRGKIRNPSWIVNALIREGAVGVERPATAIGQDYPLALSRGIINVTESRIYPNRYSMELLKTDVAVAVSEVLEQQAYVPEGSKPTAEDVERAGTFISPAAVRIEKKLPPKLSLLHDELVMGLRNMRKGR